MYKHEVKNGALLGVLTLLSLAVSVQDGPTETSGKSMSVKTDHGSHSLHEDAINGRPRLILCVPGAPVAFCGPVHLPTRHAADGRDLK
jgi:hypothetical protein